MSEPTLFSIDSLGKALDDRKKQIRKWENAFQRWSNKESEDGYTPEGCCGTGGLCDYCVDNSYGRPCVRALNALCREKHIKLDYTDYDFTHVWYLYGLEEVIYEQ